MSDMRKAMESVVKDAQNHICSALAALDETPFREDVWTRAGGGGGVSRVLQGGKVFEKAGVNVSVVQGRLSPAAARSMGGGAGLDDRHLQFYAAGLSVVIHPTNPMVPTVHANYRYFERGDDSTVAGWWFGGGADLTPSYLFEDDAIHFHTTLKEMCDAHDRRFYPRYKTWCDEYFWNVHRGEARGIGGIFFDDVQDRPADELLAFIQSGLSSFVPSYLPIVERRTGLSYAERHKRWQQIRRGRYVEFNLLYDRGTVFGLRTGGRIESILMSLPLTARWEYGFVPEPGSEEERLQKVLEKPRDWV